MKNIFGNMMKRTRRFTAEMNANYANYKKRLDEPELLRLIGSPAYDEEKKKIDDDFEGKRLQISNTVIKDLSEIFIEARKNIENYIFKELTSEMVNTLAIIKDMKSLTPSQYLIYAKRFGDCPIALQRLQELASEHNIHINVPTIEQRIEITNILEDKFASYIQGYRGPDDMTPTARMLYPYFQADEYYIKSGTTTEKVDKAFWENQISISNPGILEADNKVGDWADVKYYFSSGEELENFINNKIEGLNNRDMQLTINEILNNCPSDYGAKWRHHLATGEWLSLNQDEE